MLLYLIPDNHASPVIIIFLVQSALAVHTHFFSSNIRIFNEMIGKLRIQIPPYVDSSRIRYS